MKIKNSSMAARYENPEVVDDGSSASFTARRRRLLAAIVGIGAASLSARTRVLARTDPGPKRIDVHHHFVPGFYRDYLVSNGGPPFKWDLTADLDDMSKNGTAAAILSITTPGYPFGSSESIRKIIRACNEEAANLRMQNPGKFGSFAAIPIIDTAGALGEIEYSLDTLKADGIGVFTSYGDKWLGDPVFHPVYEELNRRKAVVYVHPTAPNCCANLLPRVPNEGALIEYGTDTTRSIADLVFSGTTTRFPDIKWIWSHAGGTMPFLIERFLTGAEAEVVPGILTKGQHFELPANVPHSVLSELRKMYYDTAQTANPVALGALRKVVPTTQIVFGTDYWFRTTAETAQGLVSSKVFSDRELLAINRDNALRLLPRFRNV